MSKIIKKSYKKPDDPIYKEGFSTFTPGNRPPYLARILKERKEKNDREKKKQSFRPKSR